MKILAIMIYEEAYYEPSIEVMVIDEKDEQKYKGDYTICKTSKDFADVLVSVSEHLEIHLEIEITLSQYKELMDSDFYTIVTNYEYVIELKNKAYGLDSGKNNYAENFRKVLFAEEVGYGVFRQELVFLNEVMLIARQNFKDRINTMLMEFLPELIDNSYTLKQIQSLKERKTLIEKNIERQELNVKNQKEDIKRQKQSLKELDEKIRKMEEMK